MSGLPKSAPGDPLTQAITEQRQALVRGDLPSVQASAQALIEALNALRASLRGPLSPEERKRVQAAAASLSLNASLLDRLGAGNQRALNTLFEPASTYGQSGTSGLATPSRVLQSA